MNSIIVPIQTPMATTTIKIFDMMIPFLYDLDLLGVGVRSYIPLDLDAHPHLLCVGATGTGKTYALALLMGKLAKYESGARLVICDFKKSGFGWLDGSTGFYGYTAVLEGLDSVYDEFSARLEANDPTRNARKVILFMDEYGALVSSLDKKAAEDVKRKVGNILLMGRSLGIHLIVGIQRADAEYFRAGARDQFGAVLMLGNLSKEQKAMLAPDYRESMIATNQRGQGYLLLDGQGLSRVQVPKVTDADRLHQIIKSRLFTPTPSDGAGGA